MPSLFRRTAQPPEVRPVPRAEWTPLLVEGTRGVEGKVLVSAAELTVAMLRFSPDATLPEHEADHETEVICLEGNGFVSQDGLPAEIHKGESVHWPAGRPHRLWTESSVMLTLMVEHPEPYRS